MESCRRVDDLYLWTIRQLHQLTNELFRWLLALKHLDRGPVYGLPERLL